MCLAVPMEVLELKGGGERPEAAVVSSDGVSLEVRLDIVDRVPRPGDFVIVHAGFAIHTIDPEEAEARLSLLRELAGALEG